MVVVKVLRGLPGGRGVPVGDEGGCLGWVTRGDRLTVGRGEGGRAPWSVGDARGSPMPMLGRIQLLLRGVGMMLLLMLLMLMGKSLVL